MGGRGYLRADRKKCGDGNVGEMWGQTERSPFFLTLGGENRRTTRLSAGVPENVKKSVRAAAFIRVHWCAHWIRARRLRDAKRVYERTTKGRARDACQELLN